MALYSPKYNYVAHFIPKCACTFVRCMFLYMHHDEYDMEMKEIFDKVKNNKEITNTHSLIIDIHNKSREGKSLPIKKCPRFVVVRNPYSRAVSMYTDKYIGNSPSDKWGKEYLPKDLTFNQFLDTIKILQDQLESRPNSHFHIQMKRSPLNKKVTSKIKIEDGNQPILDWYKYNVPNLDQSLINDAIDFGNMFHNPSHYGDQEGDATNINFYKKPITHTKESFLTTETKQKIFDIYKKDFTILGYEP